MEKILAFQTKEIEAVRKIAGPLRIRVVEILPEDFRQPIENLTGTGTTGKAEAFTGKAPGESLLLFCGLTEKHLDKVLQGLKQKKIQIDYKAVLTDTNKKWSVLKLYLELEKEKHAISQQRNG